MADPVLNHIDHGVESWDSIFNTDMDIVSANFVRSTKSANFGESTMFDHVEAISPALVGASYTFANLIPAGCILLGVTTIVTTLVTGATGISVGDGVTAGLFATNSPPALNTQTDLTKHAAGAVPKLYPAANNVVLTAVGPAFTAGVVRVIAHILRIAAPTS